MANGGPILAEEYLRRAKDGESLELLCQSLIANEDHWQLPDLLRMMFEWGQAEPQESPMEKIEA